MTNLNIDNTHLTALGQQKAQLSEGRTLGSKYATLVAELGDAHVVALFGSVLRGEWSPEVIKDLVKAGHSEEGVFFEICKDFIELGILTSRGRDFAPSFVSELADTCETMAEQAPPRMLPLTSRPTPWTTPRHPELNLSLVKAQAGVPLDTYDLELMPRVYEAVNKMQDVAYEINPAILGYLDKLTTHGMDHIQAAQVGLQKALVTRLADADELYFYVTMDYRGRMYARGGILSYQGADFQKAAFRFKEERPLGEDGLKGLAVHMANMCGIKGSLVERINWAMSPEGLQHAKETMAGEHFKEHGKKEAFQAITACAEWVRVELLTSLGHRPEDIMSQLICHQDGTCNGLQHGAALTGCRKTALAVNCTASSQTDTPADIYRIAADEMLAACKELGLDQLVPALLSSGRDLMKFPVMVTGYGAGVSAAVTDFIAAIRSPELKEYCVAKDTEVKIAMNRALLEVAAAMVKLTQSMQYAIEPIQHKVLQWEASDAFMVVQASNAKEVQDRSYAGSGEYTVRTDVGVIHGRSQITAVSPNFIHSMDAAHLRSCIRGTDAPLSTVHDSVGSHASEFRKVNKTLRESFVTTHLFDWFGSFNHYNGTNVSVTCGDYNVSEAIKSNYLFS